MEKDETLIMVVERKVLFAESAFQGFRPAGEINYEGRILKNFRWIKRVIAEENPEYKQPIAYASIVNPKSKKVFAYQRSAHDARYSEKRLQGKWSCGVGGHIEELDINQRLNPIQASIFRELEEEIEMSGSILSSQVLGYINDDKDAVGRVHFGLLYLVETNSETVKPKDPEIASGNLISMKELEKIVSSSDCTLEGWSNIALEQLKRVVA